MFERFTEHARQVVVLAQEEARTLQHNRIGTEHILLGLVGENEGVAARALEGLGITRERVRAEVVRTIGLGEGTSSQIPFTPRAKRTLERSLREALSLGRNSIGTEHILLGLVEENEAVATRILLGFDADPGKIRDVVIGMLSGPGGRQQAGKAGGRRIEDGSPGSSGVADSPRIGGISDAELDELIDELVDEEEQISHRRRILLGKIDVLRAERDNRRRPRPEPDS